MANLGKVLLVDDDEATNYISANMLRLMHAAERIAVAKNGRDALELVAREPFDLVLLDTDMAVMDGFEFLEAMKLLQEATGIIPPAIVMLTASEQGLDKASAAQYPVKGCLTKPLTQGQVNRLVHLVAEGAA